LPQQQPEAPAELPWQPSYVLANFYRDGQQSVGSHTDRLGSLGPLPTIASVSLGAGRVFRLHPADSTVGAAAAAAAAGRAAGGGACGSSSSGSGRVVSSIDIHLPHNSLLIMWPPTQEQWKHEVGQHAHTTHSHVDMLTCVVIFWHNAQNVRKACVHA
jgi:alkylated DNA repair dioxygenase AlkB